MIKLSFTALGLFFTVAACGPSTTSAVDAAAAHVDAPSTSTHVDAAESSSDAALSTHTVDALVTHSDDAAVTTSSNPLGIVCTANVACPDGGMCIKYAPGDQQGICTPACTAADSSPCTNGYAGPAGGMPECVLTNPATNMLAGCAIICSSADQCPTGTQCTPVNGGSVCEPFA